MSCESRSVYYPCPVCYSSSLRPCLLHSSLARTRPSSAEPLHGIWANDRLVSTLGKRPEDEDAAIAMDWSPRGGRKQQSVQNPRGRTIERQNERGGDVGCSSSLQLPLRLRSPSRSWPRTSAGSEKTGVRHRPKYSLSTSPGLNKKGSLRRSNAVTSRHDSLSYSPRPRRRGNKGRRLGQERGESSSSCDDEGSFAAGDSGGGSAELFQASPFDSTGPTRLSSDLSPSTLPPRDADTLGNLGGPFALIDSPYRIYRAKHARLLRAQSSDRAAAETRREKLRGQFQSQWPSRSTSFDSAGQGRRKGKSGMTSPLLRGEGFGLLESNVAEKVSFTYGHTPIACRRM